MFEFLLIADSSGFFLGLLGVILFLISSFLVFIILIQRGKGGGIAGSLTGTAQSAFGARGGDILMWLTLSLTLIWILLCCVTIFFYSAVQDSIAEGSNDLDIVPNVVDPIPNAPESNNSMPSVTEELQGDSAAGETPSADIPTIETADGASNDNAATEKTPPIDKPESANTPSDDQETEDVPAAEKE
jgi:preprotein translocase subunit SecG